MERLLDSFNQLNTLVRQKISQVSAEYKKAMCMLIAMWNK